MGFNLFIEKVVPKEEVKKSGGGKKFANQDDATIFVGGLSYNTTEDGIAEFFADCGDVSNIRIAVDHATGNSKGFAHVEFTDASSVGKAVKKSGEKLDGRTIRVDEAGKKEGGGSRGGYSGRGGRGSSRGGRGGY